MDPNGETIRVVADHSDNMGFFPDLFAGKPEVLADPTGRRWYDMIQSGKGPEAAIEIIVAFSQGKWPKRLLYAPGTAPYRSAWRETIKAAEEANDPGRFTAFIGFEWTSNTGGNNLHRNVIFREDGARASLVEPYTTVKPLGSDNPRDLWKWMADAEQKTASEVLAIAHNGNLSNGRMFPIIESFTGQRIDRAYAEHRLRWEPLYEATQIKGDGETHPFLAPNDEFANFEREALFDAMKRRETYATTGPRMLVRFFGGWDFTETDAHNLSNPPAAVYRDHRASAASG